MLKSCAITALAGLMHSQSALAADQTDLQIWIRASPDSRKVYEAIAERYKAKTGTKIEYFNTITDFEQRLARAAAGNDLPDVVFDDASLLGQFVQMGIVDKIDRTKVVGGNDLSAAAWESARGTDGNYYSVPTSAQAFALFIRKDWREKLKLPVPKTWADLEAMARAFTERDPDGNGKADTYGFIVPGSTNRGYTSWFLSAYVWQAGGEFVKPSGQGFRAGLDGSAAAALKMVRGMMCNKHTQPGAINATTADANPAFRSGQAGMYFTGPYAFVPYDKEPGKDKYEVVAPPAGPKSSITLAEGTSAYIMKASKKKAQAKSFLEFMISPEGQTLGMTAPGQPVVRLPVNTKVDINKVLKDERWGLINQLYVKNSRYVNKVPNWTAIRQISADGFNKALASCTSDIDTELAITNTKINDELARQKVLAQ
ncbi:MAG: sugar ABC transporter substrate-binding protein [Brachymonas sp.]|nr:sugar ABC transporter substrate-binding protein [Brachymonas sp.]